MYPGLRPRCNMVNLENFEDSNSTVSFDQDSGSEYIPYVKNLSFSSNETDCNNSVSQHSEVYQRPEFCQHPEVCQRPEVYKHKEVETSKRNQSTNKRIWDKTDVCIFCEKNVTNFTRHLIRKHGNEMEVAKFEALPKGSKERKLQADILRKRGNFLGNIDNGNKLKLVRRPYQFATKSSTVCDYLPCKYCFGMFKKKYLYRHFKICKNVKTQNNSRNNPQADGQNLLLTFTETDEQLQTKVFPRMATDHISVVAKTDKLITTFGARYLKSHKEKHLISVVSQKMRILARLLIALKCENSKICSLQDCLTPKYFDLIVKCSKIVANYDEKKESYASPSVVLKLGQSLKQCCDIAEFLFLKKSDSLLQNNFQKEIESVKNMKHMLEKQWCFEISSNACKEIYQKKWNKPSLLPLTSDIKLFKDHITKTENESYNNLKVNPNDVQAFRKLQECILAQVVLLNRRRSGEVQRILLTTYKDSSSEVSQEEITQALSSVEMELTKYFKRIIIRGKRGRGVPVLFTPHLTNRLEYLLKIRESINFITDDNPYLFPVPQSLDSCMRAADVIRKFSQECGAKHPENITSTRLRKHVATVTQILNLSEGDLEQLATFMGHTKNVHKEFYRLSDNAFQVNIPNILLLYTFTY